MQKSMLVAAFLLPLLVLIPFSAYAQTSSPPIGTDGVTGMTISDDGTEVYVVDNTGITRLALSSPFEIASATVHTRQSFTANTAFAVQAVAISNDGSRIFLGTSDFANPEVVQVSVMADRSIATPNNPPSCCDLRTSGMTISRDGTWLIIGGNGLGIRSYQLGTPFDISTGVTQNSMDTQLPAFAGASISNDGTMLFTIAGATVRQYALSTPYVASSINASPVDTFEIEISGFDARDMDFSSDGMNMYVLDTNNEDVVHQYPLTAAFTLSVSTSPPPAPVTTTITANDGTNDLANGADTNSNIITFTVQFSEDVTGFTDTDIVLTGSANNNNPQIVARTFTPVNAAQYTFMVHVGSSPGDVTVSVAAGAASSVSNSLAADPFTATFAMADTTPPTVVISSNDVMDGGITTEDFITLIATFDEPLTAGTFTTSDVTVDDGDHEVLSVTQQASPLEYHIVIEHDLGDPNIEVSIDPGMFTDLSGNTNTAASNTFQYGFQTAGVPTVVITSTDVSPGGTTTDMTAIFIASFNVPIEVSTFTASDITVTGTSNHMVLSVQRENDLRYNFRVLHADDDAGIVLSIGANSFSDRLGTFNTAASNSYQYNYVIPPTIILPIIESQYVTNEEISLQFGQVSGRPAAEFTLGGAPASATITAGGAFTWTPDTAGIFSFNVIATNTDGSDTEPVILRVVNSITPLVTGDLVPDDTFERDDDDAPIAVAFSNDGLHMFVMASAGSPSITDITRYTTITPFDFANTTSDANSDITRDFTSQVPSALQAGDLEFSNDGRTMILIDAFGGMLYEFALDAPYTLEPRTQVDTHQLANANIPTGFTISPDGTKLFTVEGFSSGTSQVDEHTLAVPFSLSDITYDRSYSLGSNPAQPQDVAFHNSTAMLVIGSNGMVYEHTVSPFTLDGASYSDNSQQLAASAVSMAIADNGLHLFVLENALDDIFRYTVIDTSQLTVEIASDTSNPDPIGARASFTVQFSNPVTEFDLGDITVSSVAPNSTVLAAGTHVASNLTGSGMEYTFDVLRGPADATVTVSIPANAVEDNVESNDLTADLELSLRIDYNPARSEPRTIGNSMDIDFSFSGGLMYTTNGGTEGAIHRYDLGTDFDITTAPDTPDQRFAITRDSEPASIEFSENRLKVFVLGGQNNMVDAYNLGSIFSIQPSPTYDGESLSVASATTAPAGLEFSRDGTHMYVVGTANDGQTPGIYDFALSTGFDVSTGTADGFVSSDPFTDNFPIDLTINDEGTIMYVLSTSGRNAGSGDMRHLDAFTFGVAYDVRTLTFEATQPLVTYPTRGMASSPDFSRLYVVGVADNPIAEFTLNNLPELVPMIYRVTEDDDVSTHSITATDADGDTLEYRLSNHPSWLTINSATGQLMGTVPQDTSSSYRAADTPARCNIINGAVNFSVTVSDDGFDADASDNVHLEYTFDIFNNGRSPNAPPVATSGNILLAETARQLDLADHTVDADTADILTYSSLGVGTGESNIVPGTLAIDSAGLATFMLEPGVGTSVIRYAVCDGSDLETLQVTIETFAVIRDRDQTINEGQSLDSLRLYLVSNTDSQLSEVTEITGEIGVEIFTYEEQVTITDLVPLNPGSALLNGTRPTGGSLTDDDLQTAFRIASNEIIGDTDPRVDDLEAMYLQQVEDGVPFDDLIDLNTIINTIPYDFVDDNLAQSPPIPITYTLLREDGGMFTGSFDIVVNRTDRAPISTMPESYVFDPSDRTIALVLADHFSDPDGDDIIYNVTNPNPEFADITLGVSDTALLIDPVAPGNLAFTLCAESQATGVARASLCEDIVVIVRGTETVQRNIFLDSEIFIRYMGGFGNVVLNADNIVINRAIVFDHLIITSDLPTATGEIRINSTGATDVDNLRLPDRIVDGLVTLTERSGTISDGPTTTSTSSFYNATFTAILHGPAGSAGGGFVSTEIIPLFHDTLNVHYQEVSVDAPPVRLVPEAGFGPRHSTDRFEIPVYDLFEDPDNSRPGPLNVTITAQSNSGLDGEVEEDLRGDIFGRYAVITPPNDGHTGQTRFTFTVDDGVNDPVEHQLLFRFEADPTGTLPVEFPQSPVSRIYLHPGFNPFVIDLPDLIAEGNSTFADAIMVNNIRLPDDSFITATTIDGDAESVRVAPGMAPLGRETMMVDVVLSADPTEQVITNYRVAFAEGPPPPQVSSGGSDDSRWKSKATFGKSYTTGLKSVDCGYSMDNTCRDVTDYHVNYLRESIETDSFHDFTLKTSAPNGLRSLGIAFGVPGIGSSLNAAEALVDVTLERDYTLNSTYRISDVTYTNENNVIGEDAGFSIHKSKCLSSDAEPECVTLNIDGVQFREQMYHAPFVIHAMDSRGYVTIHYMNDGLLISGESLNEPPTHDLTAKLAHQRDLAQLSLTRTDKLSDVWTDQFGYTWTKNSYGTWSYVEGPKIVVSPICDDPDKRVCNAFAEKLAAYNIQLEELRDSLYGKAYTMPAFDDLHETLTIQDIDGDSRERFLADNDLLWLLE